MSRRTDRVAELVQQEVAKLIQENLDPKQGIVTITSAQVTPDLRWADIWVSIYQEESQTLLDELKKKRSVIQTNLDRRLRKMKYVPRIRFKLDQTAQNIDRMEKLLKKIKKDQ